MVSLVDLGTILIALSFTLLVYLLYYQIFIIRYINRIKLAVRNGEAEKARILIENALRKQPKRMARLLQKYGI